jgi:hypothetical protein
MQLLPGNRPLDPFDLHDVPALGPHDYHPGREDVVDAR